MYRSHKQRESLQHEATGEIELVVAYQTQHGSTQLIVPSTDQDNKVTMSRTVHAEFQPELSHTHSIWKDRSGNYYRVVAKDKFYTDFACS